MNYGATSCAVRDEGLFGRVQGLMLLTRCRFRDLRRAASARSCAGVTTIFALRLLTNCTENDTVGIHAEQHADGRRTVPDSGTSSATERSASIVSPSDAGAPHATTTAASTPSSARCSADRDCDFALPYCCGCRAEIRCIAGVCEETGVEVCTDEDCCFSGLGCDDECRVDNPYPDYDGTCGDDVCEQLLANLDAPTASDFRLAGCCTSAGDDGLAAAGNRCGVDGVTLGVIEPGSCVEISRPGRLEAECEQGEDPQTQAVASGCCTESGFCGVLRRGYGCMYEDLVSTGRPCTFDEPDAGGG